MSFLQQMAAAAKPGRANFINESADHVDAYDLVALCESSERLEIMASTEAFKAQMGAIMNESTGLEALNEGIAEAARDRIKKWFETIKKWIKSLIDKLKVFKDGFTKNGDLYISRYEGRIRDKDLSKFKAMGYEFNDAAIRGLELKSVVEFVKGLKASKGDIADPQSIIGHFVKELGDKTDEALTSAAKTLSDDYIAPVKELVDSSSDIAEKYTAACISGFSASKDRFSSELAKHFYGASEKKELKPRAEDIIKAVKDNVAMDKIQKAYTDLDKEVSDQEKVTLSAKEKADKEASKAAGTGRPGEVKAHALASEFIDAYLAVYKKVLSVALTINAARTDAAKAMMNQALHIAKAAVGYNPKSESIELDAEAFEAMDAEDFADLAAEY